MSLMTLLASAAPRPAPPIHRAYAIRISQVVDARARGRARPQHGLGRRQHLGSQALREHYAALCTVLTAILITIKRKTILSLYFLP